MNISEKLFHRILLFSLLVTGIAGSATAQLDLKQDTLECHIIGFNVGPLFPSAKFSTAIGADMQTTTAGTMADLYKSPWVDFGLDALYKYKSNWLVSLEGDIWFGNNNLTDRFERMGTLYTRDSIIIGANGTDANVTCYNRGFSVQVGGGKLFPLNPQRDPNSGLMVRASAGYMLQQTIFMINDEKAPQIADDYALLYDHQRQGFLLTEGIGYWLMAGSGDMANLYVALELSQCWSWPTREYIIDYSMGLQGPDTHRYFDLLYGIKFCYMFPLKGKTVHDYYFY